MKIRGLGNRQMYLLYGSRLRLSQCRDVSISRLSAPIGKKLPLASPFFYLRPSRHVSIRRPVFSFSANPTNRSPPNFPKSRKIWPLLTSLFEVSAEAGRGIEKLEKLELKERARTILRKEKRKKKNVLSTNLIILKRSW